MYTILAAAVDSAMELSLLPLSSLSRMSEAPFIATIFLPHKISKEVLYA